MSSSTRTPAYSFHSDPVVHLAFKACRVQDNLLGQRGQHVLEGLAMHRLHLFHNPAQQLLHRLLAHLSELGVMERPGARVHCAQPVCA